MNAYLNAIEASRPEAPARLKLSSLGLTEDEAAAPRALMRRLDAPAPTLALLIRHAELYGTVLVYETAEDFLGESELVSSPSS